VQQKVDHWTACAAGSSMVARTIAAGSWSAVQRKLNRLGAKCIRVPRPDGRLLVLATAGPGEPVRNLTGVLTRALEEMPVGGRASSSQAWALSQAQEHREEWELVGVTYLPVDQVVEEAKRLGVYVGPLPGVFEEHELAAVTSRLVLAIGMRRADRARWWATQGGLAA
jgi:hypothetical protein